MVAAWRMGQRGLVLVIHNLRPAIVGFVLTKTDPSPNVFPLVIGRDSQSVSSPHLARRKVDMRHRPRFTWSSAGSARLFSLPPLCKSRGMARRGGACPGFLTGRPGLGGPGSPGPGAHDASARASRRAIAALSAVGPAGVLVRRGGYPRTARVRGCEPRPRVPRPAPRS